MSRLVSVRSDKLMTVLHMTMHARSYFGFRGFVCANSLCLPTHRLGGAISLTSPHLDNFTLIGLSLLPVSSTVAWMPNFLTDHTSSLPLPPTVLSHHQ